MTIDESIAWVRIIRLIIQMQRLVIFDTNVNPWDFEKYLQTRMEKYRNKYGNKLERKLSGISKRDEWLINFYIEVKKVTNQFDTTVHETTLQKAGVIEVDSKIFRMGTLPKLLEPKLKVLIVICLEAKQVGFISRNDSRFYRLIDFSHIKTVLSDGKELCDLNLHA